MATALSKKDRIIGAIVGSAVADAASMGTHWIYSKATRDEKIAEGNGKVLFHEPPACPFYNYEPGSSTPYGDENKAVLASLHKTGGLTDPQLLLDDYAAFGRSYEGRLNHALKGVVEAADGGKRYPDAATDSSDSQSLYRSTIVGSLYAGRPEQLEKVEEAIKVEQNSTAAIECGKALAQLLGLLIDGGSIHDVLDWIKAGNFEHYLMRMRVAPVVEIGTRVSHDDAVVLIGPGCTLPGALASIIHALTLHPNSIADAVEATCRAGGDTAGRAAALGALFGAAGGVEGIPEDWMSSCGEWLADVRKQAEELADKLVE